MEVDMSAILTNFDFIVQSNLIEHGAFLKPGTPQYNTQLRAIEIIKYGTLIHPCEIHKILASGLELGYNDSPAGSLRSEEAYVGSRMLLPASQVPMMLGEWWHCLKSIDWPKQSKADPADRESLAWKAHDHFVCIHPFDDGNGRTARLVLNMVRTKLDLPWHIVWNKDVSRYFDAIRSYEDNVFKKQALSF